MKKKSLVGWVYKTNLIWDDLSFMPAIFMNVPIDILKRDKKKLIKVRITISEIK